MCLACRVNSFPHAFDIYRQHYYNTGHQFTSRKDDVACVFVSYLASCFSTPVILSACSADKRILLQKKY